MTRLLLILTFLSTGFFLNAQCIPDDNCIDTESPGQICPDSLPEGNVNSTYEQTITIIPPASFDFQGNPIYLSHIQLASIGNLPPGLMWETNATGNLFAVGTKYCAKVYGIPDSVGTFQLEIGIYPYVNAFPMGILVVDDTSLAITINPIIGVPESINRNTALNIYPNPFQNGFELQFHSLASESAMFSIIDELGRMVYSMNMDVIEGLNIKTFDLINLENGVYYYRMIAPSMRVSGKLLKI
jgi:hypothetical protein